MGVWEKNGLMFSYHALEQLDSRSAVGRRAGSLTTCSFSLLLVRG
jgi:hypothetical protein